MSEPITSVKIIIGFGRRKTKPDVYVSKTFKRGEGRNLFEAIKDLFNKPFNFITQDQMTAVRKEIMVTKGKLFKGKE